MRAVTAEMPRRLSITFLTIQFFQFKQIIIRLRAELIEMLKKIFPLYVNSVFT